MSGSDLSGKPVVCGTRGGRHRSTPGGFSSPAGPWPSSGLPRRNARRTDVRKLADEVAKDPTTEATLKARAAGLGTILDWARDDLPGSVKVEDTFVLRARAFHAAPRPRKPAARSTAPFSRSGICPTDDCSSRRRRAKSPPTPAFSLPPRNSRHCDARRRAQAGRSSRRSRKPLTAN